VAAVGILKLLHSILVSLLLATLAFPLLRLLAAEVDWLSVGATDYLKDTFFNLGWMARQPNCSAPCKKIHFMQQNRNKTTTHSFLITRLLSITLLLSHEIYVFLDAVNQHYQKRMSPVYRSNICMHCKLYWNHIWILQESHWDWASCCIIKTSRGRKPTISPSISNLRSSSRAHFKEEIKSFPTVPSMSVRGCVATRS